MCECVYIYIYVSMYIIFVFFRGVIFFYTSAHKTCAACLCAGMLTKRKVCSDVGLCKFSKFSLFLNAMFFPGSFLVFWHNCRSPDIFSFFGPFSVNSGDICDVVKFPVWTSSSQTTNSHAHHIQSYSILLSSSFRCSLWTSACRLCRVYEALNRCHFKWLISFWC